ncbi:GNAT family N-acetyltransferase [Vibrio methylphosphonaticus]|uniref:GNAT family N-acetyltransferase n=1 Tax=Vibrio methylphosphonaticus TaxID=2946866 RepID=UPI00202A10A9|nr:GNAT family N-acetyltransferase [Vibrio methylphosphonaticus]MCL9774900.1 GNAT family N-acetyltransferase [Vibrio methylphosphonaticus]
MLTIEALSPENLQHVLQLSVHEAQTPYVGAIETIIERSTPQAAETQWVICLNGTPVGFFLLDKAYSNQYLFCPNGAVGLRSLLIDCRYQGQGVAKRAIGKILQNYSVWLHTRNADLYLTVNCKNTLARQLYVKSGFIDTDQLYLGGEAGPQHIMCFKSKQLS